MSDELAEVRRYAKITDAAENAALLPLGMTRQVMEILGKSQEEAVECRKMGDADGEQRWLSVAADWGDVLVQTDKLTAKARRAQRATFHAKEGGEQDVPPGQAGFGDTPEIE